MAVKRAFMSLYFKVGSKFYKIAQAFGEPKVRHLAISYGLDC